ncbi:MAG: hypothetical protein C5B48_16085 [Candidatus Rokuibacteriota bacterium]|nr:MAG: hypothetical protein C5B48_16085 [Candidatus Rokubacteria bacterium]
MMSLLTLAALVASSIGATSTPLAAPLPVLGPPLAAAKGGTIPNHESKDKTQKDTTQKVKKSKKQPGTPGTPTPGDEKGKKDARAKHSR